MDVFSALADPVRRALLEEMAAGPARVVDLAAHHPISRPAVSKHLRLLTDAGLVVARDRGRERHYTLVPGALGPVAGLLERLALGTSPVSRTPNGRVTRISDRLILHIDRTFEAPIEDVWAAITEPERLARWLGTWRGDPTEGHVLWRMGFEDGADEHRLDIRECRPPHRLAVTTYVGDQPWYLDADLTESGGVTTLAFSQPDVGHETVADVGPGWEYYLDRLVAAETGGDLAEIDFERDYYPAMAEHYRAARDATG